MTELLDTVKARKLAYYGDTVHEETRELPGERDNARNNARCTKARKTTHGLDGQHQDVDVEETIRMTEDRDKWRKYVHGVAELWKRRSVLKFCAISRTRRWKGSLRISSSVDFW